MGFQSNNSEYNIVSEYEISTILSRFSDDIIIDVIHQNLANKIKSYSPTIPNIVNSYENLFKEYFNTYPNYVNEFKNARENTYKSIITILCNYHNIYIDLDNIVDYYSVAFYLYHFLVSNFSDNITKFFINFIIKEKNMIYEQLNLSDYKKNKNSSNSYSKKIYKNGNNRLALIHANIDLVIDNICFYDITLETLLDNVYFENKDISKYLSGIIVDNRDIFKEYIVPIIQNPYYKPIILTNIKLGLQKMVVNEPPVQ